jgi:hypothetical protein
MITFEYIEDYLEVLSGFREITDRGHSPGLSINYCTTIPIPSGLFSLARYDVSVVYNMANSTILGKALTDKQAELAIRLIKTYQRQFANKGVNVTPSVQNPKFRLPLRTIDREKRIYIRDNQIILKFPYDKILVSTISSAAKESKGTFKFDHNTKEWCLAITEYNVNWVTNFSQSGFTVDPAINSLMQLILTCEQTPYKIELIRHGNSFLITNAELSLTQYIDANIGGFECNNLIKLVDFSGILGYTVHESVQRSVSALTKNSIVLDVLLNRSCHYVRNNFDSDGADVLELLKEYATLSNRWPIYIHEPDSLGYLKKTIKTFFKPDEILELSDKTISDLKNLSNIRCVYFKKLKTDIMSPIPILLTTSGIITGRDKFSWLSKTEKIVHYTATTYHNEIKKIGSNNNN